ncbi:MAG: DUF222 domain-containing protein [Acidimicrobiia bacterium]
MDPMDGLLDAFAALEADDPREWNAAARFETLRSLAQLRHRFEAVVLRVAAAGLADRMWEAEGAPSLKAWLAHEAKISMGEAASIERSAKAVAQYAPIAHHLAIGAITPSQVREFAAAARHRSHLFERDVDVLVFGASTLTPTETRTFMRHWTELANDQLEPTTAPPEASGWCHASRTMANALKIDALLFGADADIVEHALNDGMKPVAHEVRDASQRRKDALVALCGGERVEARVDVIVDIDTLSRTRGTDPLGARCEIPSVGPISVETARRLTCDGSVGRILMRGNGEVLDVGRRSRVFTTAMQRAIVARDQHCVFPGCERPWGHLHHLVHWADGGHTSIENAALLCGHHHRFMHEGRWKLVRLDDGSYDAVPP